SSAITPTWPRRSSRRCVNGPAPRRFLRARMATRTKRTEGAAGDPYDAAVRYPVGRLATCAEIHRHLRSSRFDDEVIAQAIYRFRVQRYVYVEAFARCWLEQ